MAETLFWKAQEAGANIDFSCYGSYPLSFVTKAIRAAQTKINSCQWATALSALEFFYANTDSDNRPDRTIKDYLPYPLEDSEMDKLFDVFSTREKKLIQHHLNKLQFGLRLHALLYALGWSDIK